MESKTTAETVTSSYESNPFRPLLGVLGRSLSLNGIAALQIGVVAVAIGIVGYLLGIGIVAVIAGLLHSVVVGLVLGLAVVVALLYFIVWVEAATIKLLEDSALDKKASWRDYFNAGRPFAWRLLGLAIVMMLGIGIGLSVLIIPGLYMIGRWSLAPFAMIQENLGVGAALGRSWQLSKGHIWENLGAWVAGLLVGSNGLLASLVLPGSLAGRYEQTKALAESGAPKPKVHWLNYLLVLLFPILMALLIIPAIITSQNQNQQPQPQQFPNQFYQLQSQ